MTVTPSDHSAVEANQQAQTLQKCVGVRPRHDLSVVEIHGEDARTWINGQVTNDVRELSPDRGVYALVANVKGRILADVWVLDAGESVRLLAPTQVCDTLLEHFDKYIIMEDVELAVNDGLQVVGLQGPRSPAVAEALLAGPHGSAARLYRCDEPGLPGYLALVDRDAFAAVHAQLVELAEAQGGGEVSEAGFELARLRAGLPRFPQDFGLQSYPQEAGLKARAVSFQKGCYLGQEVVCMLENRGQVPRRLVRLAGSGAPLPAPDTPLRHDDKDVGVITSAVVDPEAEPAGRMLGYLKRAVAEVGRRVKAGDAELEVIGLVGED